MWTREPLVVKFVTFINYLGYYSAFVLTWWSFSLITSGRNTLRSYMIKIICDLIYKNRSSIRIQTVFNKWQKQTQSTGLAEIVVGSSLAPHASLLQPHKPCTCSAPSWIDWVGKNPSVKADLAIYTYSYVASWCVWIVSECGYNVN